MYVIINISNLFSCRFVIESLDTTQSILTITSASLSMDESVISCEARNRVDTASIYAVIRIEGEP